MKNLMDIEPSWHDNGFKYLLDLGFTLSFLSATDVMIFFTDPLDQAGHAVHPWLHNRDIRFRLERMGLFANYCREVAVRCNQYDDGGYSMLAEEMQDEIIQSLNITDGNDVYLLGQAIRIIGHKYLYQVYEKGILPKESTLA